MEDYFVVTFDYSLSDYPTLCVGRTNGDNLKLVNILHGDEALFAYASLIGNAAWKNNSFKTNADKIHSMTDDELAEFLMSKWFIDDVCKNCEGEYDKCGDLQFCKLKILEWLKKRSQ